MGSWVSRAIAWLDEPLGSPDPGEAATEHVRGYVVQGSGASAQGPVHGYVDGVLDGEVIGWCVSPDDPSHRLTVRVLIDGDPVAEGRADEFRESLARERISDGRSGFRVSLPPALDDGAVHGVQVRAEAGVLPAVPDFIPGGCRKDGVLAWRETRFEPRPGRPRSPARRARRPRLRRAPVPRSRRVPVPRSRRVPRSARLTPDGRTILAIVAAVVAANLLFVLGVLDPNPLGPAGRLAASSSAGPLGGLHVVDQNNGYTAQALGHLAAIDLLHLRMPWWNPYEATGAPLAGEMQSAALFPPTLLLIFGNGQLWEHMLLELIAGIATFRLLRRLDVVRWAAGVGGIAFALNGTFAWIEHAPANPVAFLPLLLLGVERAYTAARTGRPGGWGVLAVAAALSVYGGFPEVAYIDALLAGAWLLWRCGSVGRPAVRRLLAKAVIGGIVATLLSAPLLIPFVRFVPDAYLAVHSAGRSGALHLPSQGLSQLLLPYVYGNPFQWTGTGPELRSLWAGTGGYETLPLVLLALVGLASPGRRGLRRLLSVWLVLALTRTYGLPVLGDIVNLIPGMSSIEFPRYGWPSIELAVIVLAALGLDRIATVSPDWRRALRIGLGGGLLLAGAAVGALSTVSAVIEGHPARSWVFAVLWALAAIAAVSAAAVLPSRARRRLLAGAVVLDAIAMFVLAELSAPSVVHIDQAPVSYLRSHLGLARFATVGPLRPDYGAYFGIASINDTDVPLPQDWATYVSQLDPYARPNQFFGNQGHRPATAPGPAAELVAHLSAYRALGVKYVLTSPGSPLPQSPGTFTRVLSTPAAWVYRVAGAAPYFSTRGSACTVTPQSRERVRVDCTRAAVVVRRETYLRGWSAQVDGHPEPVRQVAGLFQGVAVHTGAHEITFSYAPPDIDLAYAAFALGLVWLIVGVVRARRTGAAIATRPPAAGRSAP